MFKMEPLFREVVDQAPLPPVHPADSATHTCRLTRSIGTGKPVLTLGEVMYLPKRERPEDIFPKAPELQRALAHYLRHGVPPRGREYDEGKTAVLRVVLNPGEMLDMTAVLRKPVTVFCGGEVGMAALGKNVGDMLAADAAAVLSVVQQGEKGWCKTVYGRAA